MYPSIIGSYIITFVTRFVNSIIENPNRFSLFTAYQILSADFYFQEALHTAITDAVYCVKLVVSDRRVANKLRKGLDKALHKSYNTTPAKEEMICYSLLFHTSK